MSGADERTGTDAARGDTGADGPGDYDVTDSDQDTRGDMGVSSEREGHAGPGQHGTTGTRYVGPDDRAPDADVPPEQSAGGPEVNPVGLPPKAGYSSKDPRSG